MRQATVYYLIAKGYRRIQNAGGTVKCTSKCPTCSPPQCISIQVSPQYGKRGKDGWSRKTGFTGIRRNCELEWAEPGSRDCRDGTHNSYYCRVTLKNLTPATSHLIHKGSERDRILTKQNHIKGSGYYPDFLINTGAY